MPIDEEFQEERRKTKETLNLLSFQLNSKINELTIHVFEGN